MERPSTDKRKKLRQKQNKTSVGGTNDSSYGSMKNGASSSSSLSLSLFSESDLPEAPSTSGCSSEMAAMTQSKERKKEKAKEFMKKLKSLLPMKERMGKLDTLATLEQVVNSMRQLNEDQRRDHEFKMPPPYQGPYQTAVSDKLSQSNMYMLVSPKNHVVHMASPSLMSYLGYPSDWWNGRLFKDFLNKKDVNTVNSCIALHSADEDNSGHPDSCVPLSSGGGKEKEKKYLYARIRRFRKLSEGFNLQNVVSYCPFAMTISTTKPAGDVVLEEDVDKLRKSLTIYCHPLTSAFSDGTTQADETKFSMRHSPCCKFTYVHPNAVRLLGYLPQDYTEMSIFELYHPDDLPQLLDIHKKIMLSMGQPFKSKSIRFKTRNGCYVEVDTEWSSFINPWSMKLEFIIGQHSVIKGPNRPDIFEDIIRPKAEKPESASEVRKIQDKILEVLKKPIQDVFTEPAIVTPTMEKASSQVSSPVTANPPAAREIVESSTKTTTDTSKVRFQIQGEVPSAETKSTVIDDKGISSIYNQLNYSHNIKRFLMSHPKSFSNVSDEDSSMVTRDDCDDDAINEEEEMPLEIPVVKPPSCGSSTQVHVSEQGHGEDMLSPPTFGDDMVPTQESADNIHSLTEESLKKHTKIQERLYLQRISEEQPLLFNTRKIKSTRGLSHQKRPRPIGNDEEMESAKHPCTNSGIFRSSSNIFMQNFPAVTSAATTHTNNNATDMFCQPDLVQTQATPIRIFPAPGYPSANHPGLQIPTQPIALVPGDSVGLSYIPTSLSTVVPGQGLVNVGPVQQPQNIQWPYYPQAGYTLLPQVMAGFFRPLLQPVQVQAVGPPQQGTYLPSASGNVILPQTSTSPTSRVGTKSGKTCSADKNRVESDNPSSSVEDTNSSIMYLLEADSSACEDSDNKAHVVHPPRIQKKRTVEPPWLRGVKWNSETKMRYQMPQRNLYPTLKMDNKIMKKAQQNDMAQANLIQLLEEISLPDHEEPYDEDADYMFFPGDQPLEAEDALMKDCYEVVDVTTNLLEDDTGGGFTEDDGGGGERMVMWELGPMDPDNDNFDTPVNSRSEDEIGASTPTMTDSNKEEMTTTEAAENDTENDEKDKASYVDVVDIASVFITDQPQPETNSAKTGGSQKDGSLSGDDAISTSDGGQKQETEDSQSNCSKVSSDLTPSDDRSNEEAGSSHKESDVSSKHLKGVPSVTSSNSSNEQSSPEEGMPNTTLCQHYKEIFKKLFVPLRVQVCCKSDMPGMPYWLVQAHLSEKVAMTYKIPSRLLEDVLNEDKKRMQDMTQSNTVKQQLLQLLSEVDSSVTTVPMVTSSPMASKCPPSSYLGSFPNPLQQVTSPALLTTGSGAMALPAFVRQDDQMSVTSASASGPVSILSTSVKREGEDRGGSVEEAMSANEEKPPMFQIHSSALGTNMSRPGTSRKQKCFGEESGCRPECLTSDDTNSDPMVGNSLSQSSSSQGPTTDMTVHQKRPVHIPASMTKTADMFFQDWCQAVATGVTSQSVEDIIMAKVFVTNDSSPNMDMKTESNVFGMLE